MKRTTGKLLLSAAGLFGLATTAHADPQGAWRAAIAQATVPGPGCYAAHYPGLNWKRVTCAAPPHLLLRRPAGAGESPNVGAGNDYQAVVSPALISKGAGSFPRVKVKTETGDGEANAYTLQLNSNVISGSPACDGAANPANCRVWQQFAYFANPLNEVFIQYWLLGYNNTCPNGWGSAGVDCVMNSGATDVPLQAVKQLKSLTLTASAASGGNDTLKFVTKSDAYSVTNSDDVVDLASYWQGIEYNIFGPGADSQADFNPGTKIKVGIAMTDGTTDAPQCEAHKGTTGETNNLNLGNCTAKGGNTPSVLFGESLAKQERLRNWGGGNSTSPNPTAISKSCRHSGPYAVTATPCLHPEPVAFSSREN
ncbi:MAG TPA: hypothetical protein VHU23_02725 [Rhizomicrobium sp.]|jgi:hypothetical protein|nr:hypothetical protein [Rhizomicrobium sp.]